MLTGGQTKCFLTKEQRKEAGLKDGIFTREEVIELSVGIEKFCNLHALSKPELLQIIFEHTRKDLRKIFYKYLSTEILPQRAHSAIYYRVKRMLHPNNFKGAFTQEEDEEILALHSKVGNNWIHIGESLNRMPESCRDRYIKTLKHRGRIVTKGEWTMEEQEKLVKILEKYLQLSGNVKMKDLHKSVPWTKVSEEMKTRTPNQCMHKWVEDLSTKVWKSVDAQILDNAIVLKETNDLPKRASRSKVDWTFQDDLNLLNAVQMLNVTSVHSIRWVEVAKKITYALASDFENNTCAQIRYFTNHHARTRFIHLTKSVFNGKNLTVLDICLHYLEKDGKRLNQLHHSK
eukprot:NODE_17_length_41373_cov_0.337016.p15 type:complete len:345 gc:universal NODE_17_length_41373_cov_0.337016:5677-4643(-)